MWSSCLLRVHFTAIITGLLRQCGIIITASADTPIRGTSRTSALHWPGRRQPRRRRLLLLHRPRTRRPRRQPLSAGAWTDSGIGSLAILPYETVRTARNPRTTLLAF